MIPIFEYIDDLRSRTIREVFSSNQEQTEELIEKHDKVINLLDSKRKTVLEFVSKGEKLIKDPFCPQFLQGHVKKLQDACEDTSSKAQNLKKSLVDNMHAWCTFEEKKLKFNQQLDILNVNHNTIKKIFDPEQGSMEYNMKAKRQAEGRKIIVIKHKDILAAAKSIKVFLPKNKIMDIEGQINELETRMDIMEQADKKLAFIDDFNKRLLTFSQGLKDLLLWLDNGERRLDVLRKEEQQQKLNPEAKITKVMELLEDISKYSDIAERLEQEKNDIFPKHGERVSPDAKALITRLKETRATLSKLANEANTECTKYADDVKHWAQFQTGITIFISWLQKNEERMKQGLQKPKGLVEACEVLEDCKLCLAESVSKLMIFEAASEAARKITPYENADMVVDGYKNRWTMIHQGYMDWTVR